jgi:hypothetical protein
MDERTEELRDLFVDVTDEETVTESQSEDRGSLADADDDALAEALDAVVDRLRDDHDFETALSDGAYRRVVSGFYDGEDDETIATDLDGDPATVFRARLDLHLLDDADTDFPFDLATLRRHRDAAEPDPASLAEDLDADRETAARAVAVADTQARIRRVSHRFQSEFEDAIPDAALSVRLTETATESGLGEAAEDIETDTKF